MKILSILLGILIVGALPQVILAQSSPARNVTMAVQITEVLKANAALMREYTWNSRTQLIDHGNLIDAHFEKVAYGSSGHVIRTQVKDFSAAPYGGFLRRAIEETEKQKAEIYMTGLVGFLDQYTVPTRGQVLDFVSRAKISPPDASGLVQLNGSSVVVPDDTVSLWVDALTLQTIKMEVTTFFQGDIVVFTSTSKTLPNGPTYMAYTEATIAVKQMSLLIHNYDYSRGAPVPSPPIEEKQISPSILEMEIKDPTAPQAIPPPKAPPPAAEAASGSPSFQVVEQKLRDLKVLFDKGLISQSDYDAKKAQILKNF
jgi:hypothetical protein